MKARLPLLFAATVLLLTGCANSLQEQTSALPVQQQEYVKVCGDPSQEISVDESLCEEDSGRRDVMMEWFYPQLQRESMNSYLDGSSLAGALRSAPPGSLVHTRADVQAMIDGRPTSAAGAVTTPLNRSSPSASAS